MQLPVTVDLIQLLPQLPSSDRRFVSPSVPHLNCFLSLGSSRSRFFLWASKTDNARTCAVGSRSR